MNPMGLFNIFIGLLLIVISIITWNSQSIFLFIIGIINVFIPFVDKQKENIDKSQRTLNNYVKDVR